MSYIKPQSLSAIEETRELFDKHAAQIGTISFSEHVHKNLPNICLFLKLEPCEELYSEIRGAMSVTLKKVEPFDQTFIDKGTEQMSASRQKSKFNYIVSGYTAYRLRVLCNFLDIEVPHWIPNVFKTESIDNSHAYSYLIDWSDVEPSTISDREILLLPPVVQSYFDVKIESKLSPTPVESSHQQGTQQSSLPESTNVTFIHAATSSEAIENKRNSIDIPDEVQRNIYIARKYLQMQAGAVERNIKFTLTLEDLASVLRVKRCFYTGEELIHFERSHTENAPSTLPGNYLTIDRVNNDIGYEPGNVVACAKAINEAKDRMSKEDFEQALAIKKMLRTSNINLNSEQLKIMSL